MYKSLNKYINLGNNEHQLKRLNKGNLSQIYLNKHTNLNEPRVSSEIIADPGVILRWQPYRQMESSR